MTVIEVVKAMQLADYAKSYKDVYGQSVDLKYPLDQLCNMEVKDLYINLKQETATITIIDHLTDIV